MKRFAAGLLTALLFLGGAGTAAAQATPGIDALPPEVRGWLTELNQIHEELSALQARALADPSLSAMQESVGEQMRVAMEEIDPSLAESLDRIPAMEVEAQQAESRGDQERLEALSAEAQRIEQRFMSAQNQAMQTRPNLVAEVLAFQEALQERMLETDPEAPRLIARMQELEEKLTTAARQQGMP